jgi:hypothetical protein
VSPVAVLRAVSRPEAGPALAWHPVSTRINKGGDMEGPECCAPAPRAAERDAGHVAALFARSAAAQRIAEADDAADAAARGEAWEAEGTPHAPRLDAASPAAATPGSNKRQAAPQQSPDAKRAKAAGKHTPPPKGQRSVAAFFAKS